MRVNSRGTSAIQPRPLLRHLKHQPQFQAPLAQIIDRYRDSSLQVIAHHLLICDSDQILSAPTATHT